MAEPQSLMEGYRVLDLAEGGLLFAGKILADLGADVIKIEKPGGSPTRNIGPFYKDIPDPEKSLFWFAYNTSKRSITLDIEKADGQEVFKRLVKGADFVIESFAPGYLASLGLGYTVLEEINPRIIMTSITPFGQTGPYKDFRGSPLVCWAMGGKMYTDGDADRPPVWVGEREPQAYLQAGAHAAIGTTVAHYYRELTGEGQHVDVSIEEAVTHTNRQIAEDWEMLKVNQIRGGLVRITHRPEPYGSLTTRSIWRCKDGYVSWDGPAGRYARMARTVALMKAMVEMVNRDGFALELKDYDWSKRDVSTITQEQVDREEKLFADFFLTKTKVELFDEAVKRGIQLIPVQNVKDVLECPQLAAREFFVKVEHPELGDTITYPGTSVKINQWSWRIRRRAPLVGEDNEEVYERELGMPREKLVLLKQARVI